VDDIVAFRLGRILASINSMCTGGQHQWTSLRTARQRDLDARIVVFLKVSRLNDLDWEFLNMLSRVTLCQKHYKNDMRLNLGTPT